MGCMEQLEKNGFEVVYLKPDMTGAISPEQVMEAIDEHTVLVSMMLVNNEVGSILPMKPQPKQSKQKKSPALFHVDAVQGFGKMAIYPNKSGIDLLTISGHKIHAPKGTKGDALLFLKRHPYSSSHIWRWTRKWNSTRHRGAPSYQWFWR